MKNIDDNNAVFKIENRQTFAEHDDCIEMTIAGKFYVKNGKYYILYKEYSDIGEVSVVIKAEDGFVSIRRSGACTALMNYRENLSEEVLYKLPYGNIVLDISTKTVDCRLGEDGGELRLEYDISLNGEAYSNEMMVEVKKIPSLKQEMIENENI